MFLYGYIIILGNVNVINFSFKNYKKFLKIRKEEVYNI